MNVERTHVGHQTRYELSDKAGLSCVLTYTADPGQPAIWKVLLPGPDRTEDVYGTQRFPDPNAAAIEAWLDPIIGPERAAELANAVEAGPPQPATWQPRG
jgi:hypothetical protein